MEKNNEFDEKTPPTEVKEDEGLCDFEGFKNFVIERVRLKLKELKVKQQTIKAILSILSYPKVIESYNDACNKIKNGWGFDIPISDLREQFKIESLTSLEKVKLDEESSEILKSQNIINSINKELDKKIEGEHEVRKTILLVCMGAYVKNPNDKASFNLMVNSPSGTGKDYVVSNTVSIFPDKNVVRRKRITKKVFTYWHNSKFEPDWTWDGKIFYNEDIPNSVLNEDVFKVMASSGDATSTVIINQMAFDIKIKGKPVMIITLADADPRLENLRRFPSIQLDETTNQTKAIMDKQAQFAEIGISADYDFGYTIALANLKRGSVKIPFATQLTKAFPNLNIILRTNFNRLLDYIKASCIAHQNNREQENGYYLAERQDYEIATEVFSYTTSNVFTIPLTANQQKVITVFNKLDDKDYTITELAPKMSFISRRSLQNILDKLTELGFLSIDNRQVEYETNDRRTGELIIMKGRNADFYKLNKFAQLELPSYDKIITNTSIPSIYSNTSNTSKPSEKKVGIELMEGMEDVNQDNNLQENGEYY